MSYSAHSKTHINARLNALRERHQALENEIAEKQRSYATVDLHALKARKLNIKQEIEGITDEGGRAQA